MFAVRSTRIRSWVLITRHDTTTEAVSAILRSIRTGNATSGSVQDDDGRVVLSGIKDIPGLEIAPPPVRGRRAVRDA